jgi:CheY-like chemotaxis protein
MREEKKHILIVDDSPEDIQFLMENLKDKFSILVATSGEKALQIAAREPKPEIVLMDVTMPGMNGYETCTALKTDPGTSDIDVIFVSANETTEEKLAGYDAGGCDYMTKPVDPNELTQKIALTLRLRAERDALKTDKTAAFQTAMTAMMSGGELGVILEFLRKSFNATSIEDLAQMLIQALTSYGLNGSVQFRMPDGTSSFGMEGPATAIEAELMLKLSDAGRILSKDARLFLTYGNITMLVKNIPIDDADKSGRMRDNLAILMEGAEAKLDVIRLYQRKEEIRNGLMQLIHDSKQSLVDFEAMQKSHKEENVQIVDSLMQDLEASFLSWGLSEEQEQCLVKMVQNGIDKSMDHYEHGLKTDEQLQAIIQGMSNYVD